MPTVRATFPGWPGRERATLTNDDEAALMADLEDLDRQYGEWKQGQATQARARENLKALPANEPYANEEDKPSLTSMALHAPIGGLKRLPGVALGMLGALQQTGEGIGSAIGRRIGGETFGGLSSNEAYGPVAGRILDPLEQVGGATDAFRKIGQSNQEFALQQPVTRGLDPRKSPFVASHAQADIPVASRTQPLFAGKAYGEVPVTGAPLSTSPLDLTEEARFWNEFRRGPKDQEEYKAWLATRPLAERISPIEANPDGIFPYRLNMDAFRNATDTLESLPEMGMILGTAMVPGGQPAALAMGAALGAGHAGEANLNLQDKQRMISNPEQQALSVGAGVASGLSESLPIGRMLGGTSKVASPWRRVGTGLGEEAIQEAGSKVLEDAASADPEQQINFADPETYLGQLLETGLKAGLLGGGFAGAVDAAPAMMRERKAGKALKELQGIAHTPADIIEGADGTQGMQPVDMQVPPPTEAGQPAPDPAQQAQTQLAELNDNWEAMMRGESTATFFPAGAPAPTQIPDGYGIISKAPGLLVYHKDSWQKGIALHEYNRGPEGIAALTKRSRPKAAAPAPAQTPAPAQAQAAPPPPLIQPQAAAAPQVPEVAPTSGTTVPAAGTAQATESVEDLKRHQATLEEQRDKLKKLIGPRSDPRLATTLKNVETALGANEKKLKDALRKVVVEKHLAKAQQQAPQQAAPPVAPANAQSDPEFAAARDLVVAEKQNVSVTFLQRKLNITRARATEIHRALYNPSPQELDQQRTAQAPQAMAPADIIEGVDGTQGIQPVDMQVPPAQAQPPLVKPARAPKDARQDKRLFDVRKRAAGKVLPPEGSPPPPEAPRPTKPLASRAQAGATQARTASVEDTERVLEIARRAFPGFNFKSIDDISQASPETQAEAAKGAPGKAWIEGNTATVLRTANESAQDVATQILHEVGGHKAVELALASGEKGDTFHKSLMKSEWGRKAMQKWVEEWHASYEIDKSIPLEKQSEKALDLIANETIAKLIEGKLADPDFKTPPWYAGVRATARHRLASWRDAFSASNGKPLADWYVNSLSEKDIDGLLLKGLRQARRGASVGSAGDDDVDFSRAKRRQKDLLATHGISGERLLSILKDHDGLFPAPSIAITRGAEIPSAYGGWKIIFPPDTINPDREFKGSTGKITKPNKVYGADAYSPMVESADMPGTREHRELLAELEKAIDTSGKLNGKAVFAIGAIVKKGGTAHFTSNHNLRIAPTPHGLRYTVETREHKPDEFGDPQPDEVLNGFTYTYPSDGFVDIANRITSEIRTTLVDDKGARNTIDSVIKKKASQGMSLARKKPDEYDDGGIQGAKLISQQPLRTMQQVIEYSKKALPGASTAEDAFRGDKTNEAKIQLARDGAWIRRKADAYGGGINGVKRVVAALRGAMSDFDSRNDEDEWYDLTEGRSKSVAFAMQHPMYPDPLHVAAHSEADGVHVRIYDSHGSIGSAVLPVKAGSKALKIAVTSAAARGVDPAYYVKAWEFIRDYPTTLLEATPVRAVDIREAKAVVVTKQAAARQPELVEMLKAFGIPVEIVGSGTNIGAPRTSEIDRVARERKLYFSRGKDKLPSGDPGDPGWAPARPAAEADVETESSTRKMWDPEWEKPGKRLEEARARVQAEAPDPAAAGTTSLAESHYNAEIRDERARKARQAEAEKRRADDEAEEAARPAGKSLAESAYDAEVRDSRTRKARHEAAEQRQRDIDAEEASRPPGKSLAESAHDAEIRDERARKARGAEAEARRAAEPPPRPSSQVAVDKTAAMAHGVSESWIKQARGNREIANAIHATGRYTEEHPKEWVEKWRNLSRREERPRAPLDPTEEAANDTKRTSPVRMLDANKEIYNALKGNVVGSNVASTDETDIATTKQAIDPEFEPREARAGFPMVDYDMVSDEIAREIQQLIDSHQPGAGVRGVKPGQTGVIPLPHGGKATVASVVSEPPAPTARAVEFRSISDRIFDDKGLGDAGNHVWRTGSEQFGTVEAEGRGYVSYTIKRGGWVKPHHTVAISLFPEDEASIHIELDPSYGEESGRYNSPEVFGDRIRVAVAKALGVEIPTPVKSIPRPTPTLTITGRGGIEATASLDEALAEEEKRRQVEEEELAKKKGKKPNPWAWDIDPREHAELLIDAAANKFLDAAQADTAVEKPRAPWKHVSHDGVAKSDEDAGLKLRGVSLGRVPAAAIYLDNGTEKVRVALETASDSDDITVRVLTSEDGGMSYKKRTVEPFTINSIDAEIHHPLATIGRKFLDRVISAIDGPVNADSDLETLPTLEWAIGMEPYDLVEIGTRFGGTNGGYAVAGINDVKNPNDFARSFNIHAVINDSDVATVTVRESTSTLENVEIGKSTTGVDTARLTPSALAELVMGEAQRLIYEFDSNKPAKSKKNDPNRIVRFSRGRVPSQSEIDAEREAGSKQANTDRAGVTTEKSETLRERKEFPIDSIRQREMTRQKVADWYAEADERLNTPQKLAAETKRLLEIAKDHYAGAYNERGRRTLQLKLKALEPADIKLMQRVADFMEKAWEDSGRDPEIGADLNLLITASQDLGTEQSRAFNARKNLSKKPADMAKTMLRELLLGNGEQQIAPVAAAAKMTGLESQDSLLKQKIVRNALDEISKIAAQVTELREALKTPMPEMKPLQPAGKGPGNGPGAGKASDPAQLTPAQAGQVLTGPGGKKITRRQAQTELNSLEDRLVRLLKLTKGVPPGKLSPEQRGALAVAELARIKKDHGIDLASWTDADWEDTPQVLSLMRELTAEKATRMDRAYEWWLNAILSGVSTQAVNATSNLMFNIYEEGIRALRTGLKAASGSDAHDADADYLLSVWGGMARSIPRAWANAVWAWSNEASKFGHDATKWDERKIRTAIGGKPGRIVRGFGTRQLLAADEFFKSIIGEGEAAGNAYGIAKDEAAKKKLTPKSAEYNRFLEKRMRELIEDLTSPAWTEAVTTEVNRRTFQADLHDVWQLVARARNMTPGARWIAPFITTPVNVLIEGMRAVPLIDPALEFTKATVKNHSAKAGLAAISNADTLARQSMSLAFLMFLVAGDEPDEKGMSMVEGPSEAGRNRALREWEVGRSKPQTIALPGTDRRLDYSRVEPAATAIGMTASLAKNIRDAIAGRKQPSVAAASVMSAFWRQMQDKTMLKGLTDAKRAFVPEEGDSTWGARMGQWGMRFAGSFVPKAATQFWVRPDDEIREGDLWGAKKTGDVDREAPLTKAMRNSWASLKPSADNPRVDPWGVNVQRDSVSAGAADPFLTPFGIVRGSALSVREPGRGKPEMIKEIDELFAKYNAKHPDAPLAPARPQKSIELRNKQGIKYKAYLTDDEYEEYSRLHGETRQEVFKSAMAALRKNVDILPDVLEAANKAANEKAKKIWTGRLMTEK